MYMYIHVLDPTHNHTYMYIHVLDPTHNHMYMYIHVLDPTHNHMYMYIHVLDPTHNHIYTYVCGYTNVHCKCTTINDYVTERSMHVTRHFRELVQRTCMCVCNSCTMAFEVCGI